MLQVEVLHNLEDRQGLTNASPDKMIENPGWGVIKKWGPIATLGIWRDYKGILQVLH